MTNKTLFFSIAIIVLLLSPLFWRGAGGEVAAQNIGINSTGATPDPSAMLDIDVSALGAGLKKGLLIPRVALASSTTTVTIASPATSLLVYNDGTGGLTPAGYFYNSGTPAAPLWVQLLNGGNPGTAWALNGNTSISNPAAPATYGTSAIGAAENWMGTTDARDIVFGTNNIERMRIMQTSGRVGIGTTTPSARIEAREDKNSEYAASTASTWEIARLTNFHATPTNPAAGILFGTGAAGSRGWGSIVIKKTGALRGQLIFSTSPNSGVTFNEAMSIDPDGNGHCGMISSESRGGDSAGKETADWHGSKKIVI